MRNGVLLTGEVLRQKWTHFADMVGIPEDDRLTLSEGWLTAFKKRCGLKEYKRHGEAASSNPETIEEERARDKPSAGVKGCKSRLTFAFAMNADGSEKLQPVIIGKYQRPRAFEKKTGEQLGFYYRNNAKAWMTMKLFHEWVGGWDAKLRQKKRSVLLLVDGFSAHVAPDNLTNIRVEVFRPNLTPHVQPADAGTIQCWKAHYRSAFIGRAIDRYDMGISPEDIYDINILEAMRMAISAWSKVDTTTIRNCWLKTGILPPSVLAPSSLSIAPSIPIASLLNSDPVAAAEKEVEDTLEELQSRGVLQRVNRMAIGELLNHTGEDIAADVGTSDEDIVQSVLDVKRGQDQMEADGGDDAEEGDDAAPRPTRREALEAAQTLRSYLSSMPEDFARVLENNLLTFGRHTRLEEARNMRSTSITDYFVPRQAAAL
ncbi:DDE-domain-containing protein [Punctularia strigosozonata HHB-11173 SS5]|uniref:DDE-domain-containing protein n=1 Tax=Punctularia strigosozonata (strain HHB-11173) TaxID=741275 RepID=UPI0004416E01|nr:DDE-domain-containing protein [Punctularia strigosozonata HHB-11173 SS5]EIN11808.1 DDE-domain-containing protein [Punctularia strigosozonata HHB-11173 SS5]